MRRLDRFLLSLLLLFLVGCSAGTGPEPLPYEGWEKEEEEDGDEEEEPVDLYDFEAAEPWFECPQGDFDEAVTQVEALRRVHQYFGEENLRVVEEEVLFPEGDWAQVGMILELECPDGGICDHWDRSGSIELVLDPEGADDEQGPVELLRHITPYRRGMCHYVDVTALAPLMQGRRAIRSFIDTWVGPGHAQGEGWLVSVRFVFTPGKQSQPREVINIWSRHNITVGQSDPEESVASQIEPVSFTLPQDFTGVEAHLTTTGHSFGNSLNCAEFCRMRHDVIVNDTVFSVDPWRPDCAVNPVSPQAGTWQYPRNGWCPGAVVVGHRIDISDVVVPGENSLDFDILLANGEVYQNRSPVDLLPYTIVALKLYVF